MRSIRSTRVERGGGSDEIVIMPLLVSHASLHGKLVIVSFLSKFFKQREAVEISVERRMDANGTE